jgi:hypothetical protein
MPDNDLCEDMNSGGALEQGGPPGLGVVHQASRNHSRDRDLPLPKPKGGYR